MEKKEEKRNSTKKNILVFFILIISLCYIYGRFIETKILIVKEYKVESKQIPKSFDGLKIVQFSDLHYGESTDLNYLKKVISLINKQKPDIVFFTGDFVGNNTKLSKKEINNIKIELSKIKSSIGNYAISGNHDVKYISDFKNIMDGNFDILNNEKKLIYNNDNIPIELIGLSDASETKTDYSILDANDNYYQILLAHEPDEIKKIKNFNIDIMLSGHSHNGQIRIPFIGAIYTPSGSKTYYDEYYKVNNTHLYISSGLGNSIINFRFMCTPSITLYRLYSE